MLLAMILMLAVTPTIAGNGISRLVIAHDANYPPFSYLDESNQPKGYLIDIWRAFGKANSVEIEFKLGTWQESLDMVKNGEATVHGGLFFSPERDRYLDYGPTIADVSTYLYTLNGADRMCPIGIVRGGYGENFIRKKQPKRPLAFFAQTKAMIEAASAGGIEAFVADQPTGVYYMHIFGMKEMLEEPVELYRKPLRVAVGSGMHDVLEFIFYGWLEIDRQELRYIYGKWFMDKSSNPDWLIPVICSTLLVLIIGFAIRKIGQRTHNIDQDM